MKTGLTIGTMGVVAAGLLVGQIAFAEGQGTRRAGRGQTDVAGERAGKGAEERKARREQHREQMRERMEKNREARKQLMEAVAAEDDAHKALALVRSHCESQHAERSAFHAGQMEKQLAHISERLAESKMDEARREEILKSRVEKMEARKTKAQARYTDLIASLDALKGKDDLTKADILNALRDAAPEKMRERMKSRREEMQRNRDGKKGQQRDGKRMRKRDTETDSASDA